MPQMMPINWMFSFIFFISIFFLFIIMNYYNYNIKLSSPSSPSNSLFNLKMKKNYWKW